MVLGGWPWASRCGVGRRGARQRRWSAPLSSIGRLRLHRSAVPWQADGGLLSTWGAAVGGWGGPPCLVVSLDGRLSVGLASFMAPLWRPWMRLPPTREGRGLGLAVFPFLTGFHPCRCSFGSCLSAPSCVSARRCPATSPVAHRCRGAISALCGLSTAPHGTGGAAALCSLGSALPSIPSTVQCLGLVC